MDRSWTLILVMLFAGIFWSDGVQRGVGILEGYWFPVTDHMVITGWNQEKTRLVGQGRANKLRAGCEYRSVEWNLGEPGRSVPVAGDFDDPPAVNSVTGQLEWESIWVRPPTLDWHDLFAYVWHQCPGRWYETRTLWYVGDVDID